MKTSTTPSYTWGGKGLRLIDLLDETEKKAVLTMFPGERLFKSQHVVGDASEFVRFAEKNGILDDAEELLTLNIWEKTLAHMGHELVTAMDGRIDVVETDAVHPLRGSIAPGSRSRSQIAYDYIKGLAAEGKQPMFPVTQRAQKVLFVSSEFAAYLRANGEPVKTIPKDRDGDPASIWPAASDRQVELALKNFQLATLGANEPDSGDLAKIVELKTPKQFVVWKSGLADEWRMMDSLRELLLSGASAMSSGAYADNKAGGELSEGLRHFQQAFQCLAEDAANGIPRQRTVNELEELGSRLAAVGVYTDNKVVPEPEVRRLTTDATDLAITLAQTMQERVAKYQRSLAPAATAVIGASAGLG